MNSINREFSHRFGGHWIKVKFYNEKPDTNGVKRIENDKRLINMIVEHFKEMNIQKVGPTHCTGKEAEALFREKYKDNFLSIKAGQVIEV